MDNMYLYHLRDGKIPERWSLASADFGYKATGREGFTLSSLVASELARVTVWVLGLTGA